MGSMTVRNIPDEVHQRLRSVAKERGLSTEEAVRQLLDEATRPATRLGDLVMTYARSLDVDFPVLERSQEQIAVVKFE